MQFNSGRVAKKNFFMGAKITDHAGTRTIDLLIPHQKHWPVGCQGLILTLLQSILYSQALRRSESNSDHSKMKNEIVKKVTWEVKENTRRKAVKQKICIKKNNTFTIIAKNFVREQLKN